MDYVGTERSPQRLSSEVDQELEANLLGTKINDEKIDEIILFDLQFTIPDEMLPSLNAYRRQSIIIHPSTNHQEESHHEILDAKTSETVIEDHAQRDEQLWPDSQNTIPDEFLPSLNVYGQKSIMIHPSANREVKTLRPKLRIRRPSKFKESPYTEKIWFSSCGHYVAILAEIEKIAKIISLCLQTCDFYIKKGIDLQNHPRYKNKESSDMFDVLFEDDLPQQLSESLDCGVFMVTYAECLSYGHKFIAIEFDPNALHTRYVVLLWDYGIRK
ncbi:hypothetical protein FXO37_06305 [Capsicum annuum]|nr:hypothetical protein FXO37_06305 [Capsicum annuum]